MHVGDNAEGLEAGEIGWIDKLQMGNLVAVVGRTIRVAGEGEGIEALSHRTIADGVDVNSDTGCIELATSRAKRSGSK